MEINFTDDEKDFLIELGLNALLQSKMGLDIPDEHTRRNEAEPATVVIKKHKKRHLSAKARKAISIAQKKRWAKVAAGKK